MLLNLRDKIDEIDKQIIKLLAFRNKLTQKIGAIKKKRGIKIIDKKREKEIILKIKNSAKTLKLPSSILVTIFKNIFKLSYKSQK